MRRFIGDASHELRTPLTSVRGYAELYQSGATDDAGMVIGEKNLKVQKASIGITQVSGVEMGVNAMSMLAGTTASSDAEISRVVQLLNMVTPEELLDNDDYEGEFLRSSFRLIQLTKQKSARTWKGSAPNMARLCR